MLNHKEMQKRVGENFKRVMADHAEKGLPIVSAEGDKIVHVYADGRRVVVGIIIKG